MINGSTRLLGVIGNPITHSLSPLMQNAAIAHLGANYVYLPFPIAAEDLAKALDGFAAIGLGGFSVTIPHKVAIIPLLTAITPVAQQVGAVNTVWRTDAGWQGTNTDVEGFLFPLKSWGWDGSAVTPLILGNGGAARAVVVGLWQMGCREINIVGRDIHKLEAFIASWSDNEIKKSININLWSEIPSLIKNTHLLVNTTPIGMSPHTAQSPLEEKIMDLLPRQAIAYDLVYNPSPSKFLHQAQERGIKTIDGLEMLARQGAIALEIWLQQSVPGEVMRDSLREYFSVH
jgi:shikimate dehydrogenase